MPRTPPSLEDFVDPCGFVPPVRPAIYERLLQLADPGPPPGLPANWDQIEVSHLVIVKDEPNWGWWEAIVSAKDGDMLTLRWRDYPKQARRRCNTRP